jgi:hypothetical protein
MRATGDSMGEHVRDIDAMAVDRLRADGAGDTDDEELDDEEEDSDDAAETEESPPTPPAIAKTGRHKPQNVTKTI